MMKFSLFPAILFAFGIFLFAGCSRISPQAEVSTDTTVSTGTEDLPQTATSLNSHFETNSTTEVDGTLMDLFALQGDRKCEWSGPMGEQQMTGVVYISPATKKFHSEASTTIQPIGPFTAYAVGDGATMTTWTSLAPDQKTTMAYSPNQAPSAADSKAYSAFAQKYQYHCSPWTVDPAMFEVQ